MAKQTSIERGVVKLLLFVLERNVVLFVFILVGFILLLKLK